MVIPAAVRERAGLQPGAILEVTVDDTGIRLERVARGPALVKAGKRLIARPQAGTELPAVDVAALVEEERNRWP